MKIQIDISALVELRERLGAPLGHCPLPDIVYESEIQIRLKKGIEIKERRLGNISDFKVCDSLLTYAGEQVLVYIKNCRRTLEEVQESKYNLPRFHIAWCSTLEDMEGRDRYQSRYVFTADTTGAFEIYPKDCSDPYQFELNVCKNCLDKLAYQGYSKKNLSRDKNAAVANFSIAEFLEENENEFRYLQLPGTDGRFEGKEEYNEQFIQRARRVKEGADYVCKASKGREACGVDLSQNRNLLHCHHINGKKSDNAWTNLEALCALCHKKHHPRMHVSGANRRKIEKLRAEQGIAES